MIYGEYFNPYNLHCNVLFSEQLLSKEHIRKRQAEVNFLLFYVTDIYVKYFQQTIYVSIAITF